MSSKYVDTNAIMQVIGSIFNKPSLLEDDDRYSFNEQDFPLEFHKILFGSIYNLFALGASEISISTIEDYLAEKPKKLTIYKNNNGAEYLKEISNNASLSSFDYYYGRMKKMSLLRAYDSIGMDMSWIYDIDNFIDIKKKQAQDEWLDSHSLQEIADEIDEEVQNVRNKCVDETDNNSVNIGDGIDSLIENLLQTPDIGFPLFDNVTNTVTRGARLKKFYIRSAATGVGKSRSMLADACYMSCEYLYDEQKQAWEELTVKESVLFISTELELSELQTMALAFISGVNEQHITTSQYDAGELERVKTAAEIIKRANLRIEYIPDFSLKDIENIIKRNIRQFNSRIIFLDYLHTSMKILEEITQRSGGVKIREDNVLFMLSVKLKDLCNQYNVFIMTATQLNADFKTSTTPDQTLLRGAKSIADKTDFGCILLDVTQEDLASLESILSKGGFEAPNVKCSIYKNRGNPYKGIYLWMKADKGTSRFKTLFTTRWNYEILSIEETEIIVR